MLKFLFALCLSFGLMTNLLAASDEVAVKVSIEATANSSTFKNECRIKARRLAVEKYVKGLGEGVPETLIKQAMSDSSKYVDEVEESEWEFEDGELSNEFSITVKREELMQWLSANGWTPAVGGADKPNVKIVILEEVPDAGAMKCAEAFGTGLEGKSFFFTRYSMFQRTIRDELIKAVNSIGLSVSLLENDDAYAEYKANDPNLLGVYFDPSVNDAGDFKVTPNFLNTVRDNNPDTLALYYRIDTLAFDTESRKARVSVSISFKNLKNGTTETLGKHSETSPTIASRDMSIVMDDMANTTSRAAVTLISANDGQKRVMNIIKKLMAPPEKIRKLVVNVSNIDKKIQTRAKLAIKKEMISANLIDDKKTVSKGPSLSVQLRVPSASEDEIWEKLIEIFDAAGIEVSDDQKTVNRDTMTITPGKDTVGE